METSLEERVGRVLENLSAAAREAGRDPAEITLVAATKTQTAETVRRAIHAGVTVCGENRVQELSEKLAAFAYDGAQVHMIGHLQTNKVKAVVGRVELIHSVDSMRLLEEISKRAEGLGIVQDILLEVNIAGEASKEGAPPEEIRAIAARTTALGGVRLRGLMCIPPPALKPGDNCAFFAATHNLFVDIRNEMGDNVSTMDCLSMGMSDDYEDAVREGATLVRVGTALFGARSPIGQSKL
ncbi:Pyridoxal phosphate homeostasis protein [bioreactor metagenome]|uniref:Pyridoxal phosphate homeostasis protein n=1 Tax=bioreactor metagenome TaxID=1076179 RepID=A0A644Y4D9_9ZZZZ